MKNTILVPTDFSENARSAAIYACELASSRQYDVHLYHCYTTGSTAFENDSKKGEDTDIIKADVLIEELVDELRSTYNTIKIDATTLTGLIGEKLPLEAKADKYALIIMGTTGASKKKSVYWGSTTSAITAKSPVPVLAIPHGYRYQQVNNAALLTKFKAEELETLETFVSITGSFDSLTLIHVYKEEEDREEIDSSVQSWQFTIGEMGLIEQVNTLIDHIDKDDVNLDTVPEVVNKLIDQSNPDVVLITKTRKSFFGRLFFSSVSKEIALELRKPTFFDHGNGQRH